MINWLNFINKKIINTKLLVVFSLTLVVFSVLPEKAEAQEASFYLSPSEENYQIGETFSINVMIGAEEISINAGQAVVYFPTDKLKVSDVSKIGSIFSLWVQEPVFSNSKGEISFGGGLPSPGYRGRAGKVITVFFQGKVEGTAKVNFGNEIITANDPWGTNVFSFSQGGTYSIFPPEKLLPKIPVIDKEPPYPFEITVDNEGDPTNPQPLLYFQTQDKLSGMSHYELRLKEEVFRLEAGETMPYRLPKLTPGTYEVSAKAFDKAGNFTESKAEVRIESILVPQITICPKTLNPADESLYAGGTALANSKVIISFERGEELIKTWEVNSDGEGNWFLVKEAMAKSGIYKISAKTEDSRGAISNSSEPCFVKVTLGAIAIGPWILSYKSLSLLLLIVLVIILILIFYLARKIRKTKRTIERETDDLKQKFYKEYNELKSDIEKELKALERIRGERGLTEEEKKRRKDLLKNLADVEEVFSREIKDIEQI